MEIKQGKPLCHDKAHMALDLVDDAKRKLRHAAHLATHPGHPDSPEAIARNQASVENLYRAARALVAAELIRDTPGEIIETATHLHLPLSRHGRGARCI